MYLRTCMKPSVGVDGRFSCRHVVEVTLHSLRSAKPDFASFVGAENLVGTGINDLDSTFLNLAIYQAQQPHHTSMTARLLNNPNVKSSRTHPLNGQIASYDVSV